ncbi:MAG: CRTAC1 family protein [Polyangiaceae bacterium]
MRRPSLRLLSLGLVGSLVALGASCDDGATSTGGKGGKGGAGGGPAKLPDAICHAGGSKWTPGTQAFVDSTSKWGLDSIGALGVRLAAVDFDHDGWTDLAVRLGGITPDDFANNKRTTWLLRNTHDGKFEDVTVASGIRANRSGDTALGRPGEVWAFADVDNDGDLDVYTGLGYDPKNPAGAVSEIMLNNGDGTFAFGPEGSAVRVLPPKKDTPAGAAFVDYDRDGKIDLWIAEGTNVSVTSPQQSRLYKGDGAGGFTEVTIDAGLKTLGWGTSIENLNKALGHVNAWSALACDLNNDGNPELLASSYGRAPNHLWQALGPAGGFGFVNRSIESGYAFDANQDWTDNESARCWCTLHPMDMGCAGVPAPMYIQCKTDADAFRWQHSTDMNPFRLGGNSGGTECADINNDGNMDLLTSEIVHWDVGKNSDASEILFNDGGADVKFTRPGNDATGLARKYKSISWNEGIITGAVFDFDNDGWPDVYFGNTDYPGDHGLLFHQDSPGHFEAVPITEGIDQHRSHGGVYADFDHDGDLDFVVGHSFARCTPEAGDDSPCYATQQLRLFENVLGQNGNYIQLTLTGGDTSNRSAIGARVSVKAGGITQTQEVNGGHGHYGSQDDLTLHFGLGAACDAEVTIRWPDAELTTQTFKLPAGYRFTVTEGADPVAVIPPTK